MDKRKHSGGTPRGSANKKNKTETTHSAKPVREKVPVRAKSSKNQPSTSGLQSKTNKLSAGTSKGNSKSSLKPTETSNTPGILVLESDSDSDSYNESSEFSDPTSHDSDTSIDDSDDSSDTDDDSNDDSDDSDNLKYDANGCRIKKHKKPYDAFDEITKIKVLWNYYASDYEDDDFWRDDDEKDEKDDASGEDMNKADLNAPMIKKTITNERDSFSTMIALAGKDYMSTEAVLGMFKIIKLLTAETRKFRLPKKKKGLWYALNENFIITHHYYCKKCHYYLGPKNEKDILTSVCPCGAYGPDKSEENLGFFFYINLKEQIEQLFKTPNIAQALKYRFERIKESSDTLEDIYDGEEYRQLCLPGKFLEHWNNLSLTINTDVFKINGSSYARVWPVYAEINELPPNLRRKHMLLAAVYVDREPPIVNNLLRPFTIEMKELHREGITWKPPETSEITSKFMVIASSLSSPIRDMVTCLAEPDDLYGCLYCNVEGQRLAPGKIVYPFRHHHEALQTDQELRSSIKNVSKKKLKAPGDNGYPSLTALSQFNIAKGVVVESMTAVFLGIVKMHTTLMLITRGTPYYIGNEATLKVIDECLLSIKPPSVRNRGSQSIKDHAQWRPADWRNWLDYAPVCLKDVLHDGYIDHLALLSEAIYYLNNDKITPAQLDRADYLLKEYARLFGELFGTDKMTINVHLLTHLTQTVRNLGPLWAHNALTFDSWNRKLTERRMRSRHLLERIVLRFLMIKFAHKSVFDDKLSSGTQSYIKENLIPDDDIFGNGVGKKLVRQGSPTNLVLSRGEHTLLLAAGYDPKNLIIYKDVLLNGIKFSCKSTEKATKFSDSLVFNDDDGSFGFVERIVQFHHHDNLISGFIIQLCEEIDSEFRARHIHKIVALDKRRFITESTAIRPAVKMSTGEETYAVRLANCWETN